MDTNLLYYGDNLSILRKDIEDNSVDLVFLDPPFNSSRLYNFVFTQPGEETTDASILAFQDTWSWGQRAERDYQYLTITGANEGRVGEPLSRLIAALHSSLQTSDLMAYLVEMAVRLVELQRILKPTGSLYLHCDPTASHYLKTMLDSIFEPSNFRTEIIWKRSSAHSDTKQGRKQHGHIHDTILFYTKSDNWTWNPIYTPYDQEYMDTFYRHIEPGTGRHYQLDNLTAAKPGGDTSYEWHGVKPYKGRYWAYSRANMEKFEQEGRLAYAKSGIPRYKRYLDEMPGVPLQDVWTDLSPISALAAERLGYPTQKPLSLLDRIIASSSNEGDVVLDPFCGCGTALVSAQNLKRRWIGIDITYLSINVMLQRLADACGLKDIPVKGAPTELEGARLMAQSQPNGRYQFQFWSLSLIGASPVGGKEKKGMDRGVDGVILFPEPLGERQQILVSVKSGKVQPTMVRDLVGVVKREEAAMGVFITLEEPTSEMTLEAVKAGFYHSKLADKDYPKVQIATIKDLLAGKKPELPPLLLPSYQSATRSKEIVGQVQDLFGASS